MARNRTRNPNNTSDNHSRVPSQWWNGVTFWSPRFTWVILWDGPCLGWVPSKTTSSLEIVITQTYHFLLNYFSIWFITCLTFYPGTKCNFLIYKKKTKYMSFSRKLLFYDCRCFKTVPKLKKQQLTSKETKAAEWGRKSKKKAVIWVAMMSRLALAL